MHDDQPATRDAGQTTQHEASRDREGARLADVPASPARARHEGPASPHALLKLFFEQRDVQCPLCRYNLRDSQSQNCPECGISLELRVGGAESHLRQWLACLLIVAIPAGFFAICSLVTLWFTLTQGMPPGDGAAFVYVFWMLTALYVFGVFVLIRCRAGFLKLTEDRRSSILLVLGIFSPLIVLMYLITFFGAGM